MRDCLIAAAAVFLGLSVAGRSVASGPALRAMTVVRVDSRNGHLVRRVIVSPLGRRTPGGTASLSLAQALRRTGALDRLIDQAAQKHDIDPLLVRSVIAVESNFDPFAVSAKGAQGLMQLVPATARRFGVKNSFDPRQNLDGGVRYLKYLQGLFPDEHLVLAAYNAGEAAVAKYKRVPPYPETRQYVKRVGARYVQLKEKARQQAGSGSLTKPKRRYRPVEVSIDSEGRLQLRTR